MNDHEKVLRRIRSEKEGAIAIARGITGLDFIDEHIAKVDAEIAAIDYALAAIGKRGEPVCVGYVYSEVNVFNARLKCAALQGEFAQSLPNGTPLYHLPTPPTQGAQPTFDAASIGPFSAAAALIQAAEDGAQPDGPSMEGCRTCSAEWPDYLLKDGLCIKCRKAQPNEEKGK